MDGKGKDVPGFDGNAIIGTAVPLADVAPRLAKLASEYDSHGNKERAVGIREARSFVELCLRDVPTGQTTRG